MKKLLLIALLLFGLVTSASAQNNGLSRDSIARISQGVVMIVTLSNGDPVSSGSGTIITDNGYITTNYHVIEGGDDFAILMVENMREQAVPRYLASVVDYSEDMDFALLQIDRDLDGRNIDPERLNLPAIPFASAPVDLGDPIHVFGFPSIGDGYLVLTQGTITTIQNGDLNGERLPVWNQTDAEISPGNSGGLAVNNSGEMVGIPTAVRSEDRTGGRLGGLIPLETILALLEIEQPQRREEGSPPLEVTPLPTQQTAPVTAGLDYNLQSNYGGTTLAAGFNPDPFTVQIISGGSVNIAQHNYGQNCVGYATAQPDYRVNWSGASGGLRFFFVGQGDTTIVVNDPTGAWHCNDDSFETRNPTVDIVNPPAGQYDIWVGSYDADENVRGTLYITERGSLTPANAR